MLVHFAFGQLGKRGREQEQTARVLEDILRPRRLKVSRCIEFLVGLSRPGAKSLPMDQFKVVETGLAATFDVRDLAKLPDAPPMTFLPEEVPMICFIKIAFPKLARSPHQNEYGRFGLAFTERFLKRCGIQPVQYYTEQSLLRDPLVLAWNRLAMSPGNPQELEKRRLQRAILTLRKPASLFPALRTLAAKVSRGEESVSVEFLTYDRYPIAYDFTAEQEWRASFDGDEEYLSLSEGDVAMVITPSEDSKVVVERFLRQEWSVQPEVRVFPTP